jgi:outer membrane protein assembly factor BamB
MYRIVYAEPDLGAVPADIRGLIEACLAKDPWQRPDLGRVAAHGTATAERLGLSPAAFWPHEVAGTGSTSVPTGPGLPTGSSLQQYYGAGTRRTSAWKFPTNNSIEANPGAGGGLASNVIVADGVVYLRDNNGTVHAVSAANSKPLWAKTAPATGIYGPAVAAGRVYYTTALALQALDAKTGEPVWAFTAPGNSELLATPAVANGLVFIGSYNDGLYAVEA